MNVNVCLHVSSCSAINYHAWTHQPKAELQKEAQPEIRHNRLEPGHTAMLWVYKITPVVCVCVCFFFSVCSTQQLKNQKVRFDISSIKIWQHITIFGYKFTTVTDTLHEDQDTFPHTSGVYLTKYLLEWKM